MAEDLSFHKKRRGVVRTSLTKLSTKLTPNPRSRSILENARNLAEKLKTLQQDFKTHQLAIIDRTDEEEALEEEQRALDDNDDSVSELLIRILRLINTVTPSKTPIVATKQLALLRAKLESIDVSVRDLDDAEVDSMYVLEEYREQS